MHVSFRAWREWQAAVEAAFIRQHKLWDNAGPLQRRSRMVKKVPRFEASLAELEQLVERMEQGNLPLEEALKLFERGVQLSRSCQSALKEAEQKVRILLEQNGVSTLKPFTTEEP
jgi:exodeoxyribonuclease VII small subunit